METEEVEIDGQLISVHPPVSNISTQNKTDVVYEDGSGLSTCSFTTEDMANAFVEWLSGLNL